MSHDNDNFSRRRGVLGFVTGKLWQYTYDKDAFQESERALRKKRKRSQGQSHKHAEEIEYNPSESEWTLFFIGETTNINSIRFRSILVDFCQSHRDKVQCILIANNSSKEEEQRLACATGFSVMPWDHPNRSSLLSVLGITQVPMVIVVSNSNGRRITEYGMTVIENYSNGNNHSLSNASILFEHWRKNESGLSYAQWLYEKGCNII